MPKPKSLLDLLLADSSVNISNLKKNPSAVIEGAGGFPVAILNRNTVSAYLIPASAWQELVHRLGDLELAALATARAGEAPVEIALDEL